jgi:ribosomal protein S18 acetylase RimI-like enzyme
MRIRQYRDDDLERVEALWRACNLIVPYNDPGADIAFCQSTGHGEMFVGEDEFGVVIATVMVGHDGHRGWVYYLAVDPERQRSGLGARMIRHAEAWLCALGVRKVQLLIRESNIGAASFYDRLGYERSPVIVMQRWLLPPHSSEN